MESSPFLNVAQERRAAALGLRGVGGRRSGVSGFNETRAMNLSATSTQLNPVPIFMEIPRPSRPFHPSIEPIRALEAAIRELHVMVHMNIPPQERPSGNRDLENVLKPIYTMLGFIDATSPYNSKNGGFKPKEEGRYRYPDSIVAYVQASYEQLIDALDRVQTDVINILWKMAPYELGRAQQFTGGLPNVDAVRAFRRAIDIRRAVLEYYAALIRISDYLQQLLSGMLDAPSLTLDPLFVEYWCDPKYPFQRIVNELYPFVKRAMTEDLSGRAGVKDAMQDAPSPTRVPNAILHYMIPHDYRPSNEPTIVNHHHRSSSKRRHRSHKAQNTRSRRHSSRRVTSKRARSF